jgi:tetratricopeptide (TPR) repeat protein
MSGKKEIKQQKAGKKNPRTTAEAGITERWKTYGGLAVILILSFIIYLPVLQNRLIDWDDHVYITNNPLVHSFNLPEIFSRFVAGNYHPLTMLTLAIEYQFFGLNATGYHAINLLLHLLNILLVFYTVRLLSEKTGIALVAALLFGIHPIHVESVAWASELKDLLYTFFFLASYIFYLKYLKDFNRKFYVYALLLFLVSLLSKAMAASLPVILILTDYFKGRKITVKTLTEKAPLFLLSIVFGIVALLAQQSSGSVQDTVYNFPQRMVFAAYGFVSYLVKLVFPLQLSAFYPYPPLKDGAVDIPFQYYAYLLIFILLAAYTIYSLRFTKKIFFGLGFFAVTVFLVLQLLPVGGAIMADRYSYIPSIGLFYLAGVGLDLLWNKKFQWIAIVVLGAFTIFFSIQTHYQTGVWKNELTLWNDVISKNENVPVAYNNRGIIYKNGNKLDKALADFNKAIELNPGYFEAYSNRGNLFMMQGNFEKAIANFNKAIELNPDNFEARYNRGTLFLNENNYEKAISDFDRAIEMNPGYAEVYINRGNALRDINRYNDALKDYNKAIELKPNVALAYSNRGKLYLNMNKYDEAISNYSKAITLRTDYPEAYYGRGWAYYYSGKKDAACSDMKRASGFGYQPASDAFLQICM